MSDLLSIGASGVTAYRSALSVVGDNIVNAETEGFARRRVVVTESASSAGLTPLHTPRTGFNGVAPVTVQRVWDEFKAADTRLAAATSGRAETRVRWLTAVENALDDGPTGIGQSLTGMFTAGTTLAADPGNSFNRRAFLTSIDAVGASFRTTAEALDRASAGLASEARTTLDGINGDLKTLGRLNIALRRAGNNSSAFIQLSDERDQLLDKLSAKVEIEVVHANDGSVTVSLPRSASGVVLVNGQGDRPADLSMKVAADGRLSFQSYDGDAMTSISPASGALSALVEASSVVAARRAQLDTMAATFATKLNDWSGAGVDANGDPGTALVAFDPADPAGTLAPAVANRDPATIAAALVTVTTIDNGDGTTTDVATTRANGNLLTLSALRGPNDAEKAWTTMVAGQAQGLAAAKSESATATARRDAAFAGRDETSGVDLDDEAADLLRFQQAYNGSAKIIQVARETLQAILEIL